MNSLDDPVAHIAGPAVRVNGRLVQRCMICGEKLFDVTPKLDPNQTHIGWPVGSWLQVFPGADYYYGKPYRQIGQASNPQQIAETAPPNCCISLVEA